MGIHQFDMHDPGHASALPGPLARHDTLDTASVDEFRHQASSLLSEHRIRRIDAVDTAPFRGRVRAASLGDLQLVYLEQGIGIDVDILEHLDYYDLMLAVEGTNQITCNDARTHVGPAHAALLSPRMRARMQMDASYRQMHLRIEQHALDRRLERLIGRSAPGPVIFDLSVDLTTPQLSTWMSSLQVVIRDLDAESGLTAHPLAAASVQDMLLTGLLLAQPHTYSAVLHDHDQPRLARRALARAVEYYEQHLTESVTIGDVAQHVGVSVRSLQRAFQEDLGTSPSRYLESLRLARVREDLLAANGPDTGSVTDIAYRWGFVHLSRFAAAYRRRYGETPSATRLRAITH
ncbi:AraC family transcriptional regulator [Rhodococcus koreensis]